MASDLTISIIILEKKIPIKDLLHIVVSYLVDYKKIERFENNLILDKNRYTLNLGIRHSIMEYESWTLKESWKNINNRRKNQNIEYVDLTMYDGVMSDTEWDDKDNNETNEYNLLWDD